MDSKVLSEALDPENKRYVIYNENGSVKVEGSYGVFSWDNEVDPFKLPPGFELMLADIDAGSHTPTLVSKVLAWKKTKPEEGI